MVYDVYVYDVCILCITIDKMMMMHILMMTEMGGRIFCDILERTIHEVCLCVRPFVLSLSLSLSSFTSNSVLSTVRHNMEVVVLSSEYALCAVFPFRSFVLFVCTVCTVCGLSSSYYCTYIILYS